MKNIYLDYAATTPCDPQVLEAMVPLFTQTFANTNSPHRMGQAARKTLEDARAHIAQLLNARANEIVFTSGGSESNNHIIHGVVKKYSTEPCHIIASSIEHHSMIAPLEDAVKTGHVKVTWINPDSQGIIHPDAIKQAIRADTRMVIVHHANNQIGTIEPIEAISTVCKEQGLVLFVDAVQTIGHIPVDVIALGADAVSFSAHKFYGPKGVGALYINKKMLCPSFILGGDQERGQRAGTVNVSGAVGLAKALELAYQRMSNDSQRETALRQRIISHIQTNIPGAHLNGHPTSRLPNNVNMAFEGIDSEQLITALDLSGIAVSMGSACTSGRLTPSHVLKAIGLPDKLALGALRITVGRLTSDDDVGYFLKVLQDKVASLRSA